MPGPRVLAVVGPTASGKSALAVRAAQALGGEVVSGDAYQVYRGMDIGTATPTSAERLGVPHHLLDVLPVTATASVAEFQQRARTAIEQIRQRERTPVLAGGSALYVRAVLDDFDFPGTDPQVRARWEAVAEAEGPAALHERLARLDPAAAADILPGNVRRVVRALEVGEITGAPFATRLPPHVAVVPSVQVGLAIERTVLDDRIAARVHRMWADGLLDEVRTLREQGLRAGVTASRALGYPQALAHLDGTLDRESAIAETIRATRSFARRQQSWFRRDPRVHWVDAGAEDLLDAVLAYYRHS